MFAPGDAVLVRGKPAKVVRNVGGGDYHVVMEGASAPVAVNQRQMKKAGAASGPDGRSGVQTKAAAVEPKGKSPAKAAKDAAKTSPKAPKGKGKGKGGSKAAEPASEPAEGSSEAASAPETTEPQS